MLLLSLLGLVLLTETDAGSLQAHRLDRIQVTATRRSLPMLEQSTAGQVLDAETIGRRMPQTLAEAFRGQPGLYYQQTTPGQGNVIIRGLKGSEVLHLVDGVRLNNAFFRNAPNQYLALLDAQQTERAEVVRGPLSTLYGGDAMGGVLQVFSRRPLFQGPDWQSEGLLRTRAGGADASRLLHWRQAAGRAGLGASIETTRQRHGLRRVGGGEKLVETGFDFEALSLRMLAEPASGHSLYLSGEWSRQPSTPRHDALVPGFGQSQPESALFLFEPNARRMTKLSYENQQATPLWDALVLRLARQQIDDDRRTIDFGSPLENRERNRSTQDSLTLDARRELPGARSLVYGLESLEDLVNSSRTRRDLVAGTPPLAVAARYPDGSTMRSQAAYAQIEQPLGAATQVSAGLRWSRYRIALPGAGPRPGVALRFTDLTGSTGFVHRLSPRLSLVGNLGRGFRPPNVFDLGTLGPRPGNRFNLPNPALGPETVIGTDLGLKWVDGPWQAEAFVFRLDYRDRITSVDTGLRDSAGRLLVQSQNAARARIEGLELGLRHASEAGSLGATLNWTRGQERLAGPAEPADRMPPLHGRIELDRPLSDALHGGLALRWAARQDRLSPRDLADPRINPRGTAGFVVFDADLKWAATASLDLRLRLENLTDHRYREHGSGLDAPGRGLSLGLDWRY